MCTHSCTLKATSAHTLAHMRGEYNEWGVVNGWLCALSAGCSQPLPQMMNWQQLVVEADGPWTTGEERKPVRKKNGCESTTVKCKRAEERRRLWGEIYIEAKREEWGRTPWGRWWSMQLRFPVSDVRPAWIDGSTGARPAHSNLPALYNSRSHPPSASILISFSFSLAVVICPSLHLSPTLSGPSHNRVCGAHWLLLCHTGRHIGLHGDSLFTQVNYTW